MKILKFLFTYQIWNIPLFFFKLHFLLSISITCMVTLLHPNLSTADRAVEGGTRECLPPSFPPSHILWNTSIDFWVYMLLMTCFLQKEIHIFDVCRFQDFWQPGIALQSWDHLAFNKIDHGRRLAFGYLPSGSTRRLCFITWLKRKKSLYYTIYSFLRNGQ